MQHKHLIPAVVMVLFGACSVFAQETSGTVDTLEFQKPKNGMVSQYQAGRKQKAAWHKQQNDPLPLLVWEIIAGDNTGTYVVGRMGQHWADLDKPAVSDESDRAEYDKVIGNSVDSLVVRYYETMPKISNPADDKMAPKYAEVLIFQVRYGKGSDFQSAISQIHEAGQKTKWPVNYEWHHLVAGGPSGVFALVIPRNTWADFADKPDVKPFRDMLKEAFGQAEADSIVNRLDAAVQSETSEVIQFRPELSYLPSK